MTGELAIAVAPGRRATLMGWELLVGIADGFGFPLEKEKGSAQNGANFGRGVDKNTGGTPALLEGSAPP